MPCPVSILLPSFNGGRFIHQQIQSILDQSFSEFELLIMDDASTDDTWEILQLFEKADSRIRLTKHAENGGQNRCLLTLLRQAQGTLIAFADQDDVWEQNKLKRLHSQIHMSGRGMAFGASYLIDAEGKSLQKTLHSLARLEIRPDDILRLLFFPLASAHAMLVRRDLIWEAAFGSPMLFDWAISLDAQFASGIVFDEAAITYHRIHGSNQANGDLGADLAKRHLAPKIRFPRMMLSSGNDDRIWFFQRISYLAHSPVIARSTQRTFQNVASECHQAWFSSALRGLKTKRRCRDVLCSQLLPLAANEADEHQARAGISTLCSGYRLRRFSNFVR